MSGKESKADGRQKSGVFGGGAAAPAKPRAINPDWTLDRMFGKRRWAREWTAELCRADPEFFLHLIDQPHDYAHFLCVIALGAAQKNSPRAGAAECARLLRTRSKKKNLRHFHPDAPDGLLGIFPKLGGMPRARKHYARLLRVMRDDAARKRLCHIKRIDKKALAAIEALEKLPPEFRTDGIARCMQSGDGRHVAMAGVVVARHLNIKLTREQVQTETRGMWRAENLQQWFSEKFAALPFPPPPWEGNARIKPLRNLDEVKSAAREFKNCVARYRIKMALGYSCFYVCDHPKVMVEAARDPVFGWKIGEMEAARDGKIRGNEEKEILREFLEAGFVPAPQKRFRGHRMFEEYWEIFD